MSSDDAIMILKYPEINNYFMESDGTTPIFIKLMATILFIRQRLGYRVDETEVFYSRISMVDPQLFGNVLQEDLPSILALFVGVLCDYVTDSDLVDFDDAEAEESKRKVCQRLVKYTRAES
jgi:hypothetical protein